MNLRRLIPGKGDLWEDRSVVRKYERAHELLPQEKMLLDRLGDELSGMEMLDIGVGAGRTAHHFAPKVKRYVGTDISQAMISACGRTFGDEDKASFAVSDVRKMEFPDASFDFVMFSFNGLDCITHDERLVALQEIRRVLRPEGIFFFSAHNLGSVHKFTEIDRTTPKRFLRTVRKSTRFKLNNAGLDLTGKSGDHRMVTDGVHNFRLKLYYVRPSFQVDQLEEAGFHEVEAFDHQLRALSREEMNASEDIWLHYLCRRKG
jgi:ubiquinone/menaquinone biosynthesis C-methylase UbiE